MSSSSSAAAAATTTARPSELSPLLDASQTLPPSSSSSSSSSSPSSSLLLSSASAHSGTIFSTAINLSNTIIGAGLLTLPFSVSATGVLLGVVLFLSVLVCSGQGFMMLVECCEEVKQFSYKKVGEKCFGKTMGTVVEGKRQTERENE